MKSRQAHFDRPTTADPVHFAPASTRSRSSAVEDSSRSGFTLVEIVVSISILAMGITAVLSAFNQMQQNHALMKARSEAQLYANEVLTAVRMRALKPGNEETEGQFEGTPYRYRVIFSETNWENLYQVAIFIEWGDEEDPEYILVYTLQNYI